MEDRHVNLEKEYRDLSYICFCRDGANINKLETLCSACKRQIAIKNILEKDGIWGDHKQS